MTIKVAVFVGSLRKESFSRKIANAIMQAAPESLSFEFVDISKLGFYNQDLDGHEPEEWLAVRRQIKAADAVLFVTPEYNRSVPGVLKNAIDIISRPWGGNSFDGKPAAVVSNSIGPIGGFGAQHHLRQSLAFLNMPTLAQPEMYLGGVGGWFDDAGKLTRDDTRAFLAKFGEAFATWIAVATKSS